MGALKIIEKNNQRLLTSTQLAQSFGTDIQNIRQNFNNNKPRFEEYKHFYLLKGTELRKFKDQYKTESEFSTGLKFAHTVYLWTEKGAFLHAKSLGTDEAWEAYSSLVDDYFKKVEQLQQNNIPTIIPTTIEDILITALTNMKEMKFENAELKKAVNHLSVVVDNEIHLNDHQLADIQESVKTRVGYLSKNGYGTHFQTIFSALKTHFSVPKYNKIKRGDFDKAIDFIKGWYPKKSQ